MASNRSVHLAAALLAVAIAAGTLAGSVLYANRLEERYANALAPTQFQQKQQGTAQQAADFRRPDLLPIYGSSELNIKMPYHGSQLFGAYPTGFTISPIGKAGTTCLPILQDLAAVGPDLHGKKVVLSLSAPWFFGQMQAADSYAGNYSSLHGFETLFSTELTMATKQGIARRMLDYPKTLTEDPVLAFAARQLANGTAVSRAAYWLTWPVGKLQATVLQLQDQWETIQYIRHQKNLKPETPHLPAPLDWPALLVKARREQVQNSNNNPFGFDNNSWKKIQPTIPKQKATKLRDDSWKQSMLQSKEWTDLTLLLQSLKEMGAQPLLLSMPIPGAYYDYTGVSFEARQAYYDKLEQVARQFDVPLQDFRDYDEDKQFLIDTGAHLSREGWIYYDEALDQFYHGALH